jgi:hypothetical protein
MRDKLGILGCAAAALLAASLTRGAQSGSPGPAAGPPAGANVFYRGIGPGAGIEDVIGFVGFEAGLGRRTVTGAPFTATYTEQTMQTLVDGNHIERTATGTLARDSSGRTRRDLTLPAIVPWIATGNTPPRLVLIHDSVVGVDYVLDADRKIARKMAPLGGRLDKGPGGGPPPFVQERQNESTTASLGTQMMNGASAQGTLTTRTIPAGAIGNEKAIVITVERWYSPDLQMNVLIKRSDPRTGDNVFQLTNIVRSEPDASLFQVPADYTVKEGGRMGLGRKGPIPPLPPPPQN